jgi:outer membrane receptor protein involved in Fe transport
VTNPFVAANPGLSQIAASRTGDNIVVPGVGAQEDLLYRRRFIENGPRIESYERDVWQFIAGVRGDISDSWNFDFYVGRGKYNEQLTQDGNVSVTRVESLLDAPDGGTSICAGGLNPVGANTLSPECADYVGVLAKNTTRIEHNLGEIVFSGEIFQLPGGTSSVAIGASYQKFDLEYLADEILATGDVAGFNAEDNIIGQTDQTDVFAELYLPVAERLGFTAGARSSDHNYAGGNTSYKLELDWDLTDAWRVRSSFQHAVRAPSIGELFEPRVEDNPQVTDPCNFDSAFRAGPNAAQVEALCVAQGILPAALPTYKQTTGQIDALQGGNINLQEENADTYTLGFVWAPSFAEEMQLSVDYYSIEIEDVIDFINPTLVVNRCFNFDGSNPSYSNTYVECAKFGRSAGTGEINDLLELQENIGGLKTDGVDVQVDWRRQLGDGALGFNFVTTFVNEHSESPQEGEPFIDYIGTISQEVAEALPDVKATFTTLWDFRNFANVIRLRYLPAMEHRDSVTIGSTDPDVCSCTGVDSIVYVDASTSWQPTDALTVRLGVDNLTDEEPELYTPDQDSGTNPTVYDVIGRRYFVTINYRFGN